jgi:hypothetical protein
MCRVSRHVPRFARAQSGGITPDPQECRRCPSASRRQHRRAEWLRRSDFGLAPVGHQRQVRSSRSALHLERLGRATNEHFATGTNWAPAVDIAAPGGGRLLKDRSVFTGLIASDAWGGVNHPGQDQNRRRAGRLALSDGVGVEWKPSPRQASASARRCSAAPTPACAVPAWPRRRVVGAAARAPATTRV